jgi:hypothetical protein
VLFAVRGAAYGPLRRFAAVPHNARNGGRRRHSADAAGTATPDPERPSPRSNDMEHLPLVCGQSVLDNFTSLARGFARWRYSLGVTP